MKDKINDLKSIIEEFSNITLELLNDKEILKTKLDESKKQIIDLKNGLEVIRKDNEDLKDNNDKLRKINSRLQEDYKNLESTKDDTKKKKKELAEKVELLKNKNEDLDRQLKNCNRINAIEGILNQIKKYINDDKEYEKECIKRVNDLMNVLDDYEFDDGYRVISKINEDEKYDDDKFIIVKSEQTGNYECVHESGDNQKDIFQGEENTSSNDCSGSEDITTNGDKLCYDNSDEEVNDSRTVDKSHSGENM